MQLRLALNNLASQLLGSESRCLPGFQWQKERKTFTMEISEQQMVISEVSRHILSPEESENTSIIFHKGYSVVYNSIKLNISPTFTNEIYYRFYVDIFPHSKEIFCNHLKLSGCYYWTQSASFPKKASLFKKILTTHADCWKWEIIFGRVFPVTFFCVCAILMKKLAALTRRKGFQCWKSSALKQTSSFIRMSWCRENKPRRGRKMFLWVRLHKHVLFHKKKKKSLEQVERSQDPSTAGSSPTVQRFVLM